MSIDFGDEKQVKTRNRLIRVEAKAQLEAVSQLMLNPAGREWMFGLLSVAGVYRVSFNAEPMIMAFNEGNRNFALRLVAELQRACPKYYLLMLEEHQSKDEANASRDQ